MEANEKSNGFSRRKFLAEGTLTAVGALAAASMFSSCEFSRNKTRDVEIPSLPDKAPDGKLLRAGLIGCGGRGTGAAINFVDAGSNLEIVALGDVFQDRVDNCRKELKEKRNIEVADDKCFVGFDSYEKVIDSGVDVVLLCTPPHFRPVHLEAAINANKHAFIEKPCAVDPVGARSVMVSAKKAEAQGLSIVSGTCARWRKDILETYRRVKGGEIGEITGASAIRMAGSLWYRNRETKWSDMEYMLRNWRNFCWLSGDDILEVAIHEIDLMNWFVGKYPIEAIGLGGRARRMSGDCYDYMSVEYLYDNGMHSHAITRQVNDCSNLLQDRITGTNGFADCRGAIFDLKGNKVWEYPYPKEGDTDQTWKMNDFFVQEHIALVSAIRSGKPYNDAETMANSIIVGLMGRISAYTGKTVTWEEVMNSDLYLGPKIYNFGPVTGIPEIPAVIGKEQTIAKSLYRDY